jgi:hypothetical protein
VSGDAVMILCACSFPTFAGRRRIGPIVARGANWNGRPGVSPDSGEGSAILPGEHSQHPDLPPDLATVPNG